MELKAVSRWLLGRGPELPAGATDTMSQAGGVPAKATVLQRPVYRGRQPVDAPHPRAKLRRRDESQTRTGLGTPASPALTSGRPARGHDWRRRSASRPEPRVLTAKPPGRAAPAGSSEGPGPRALAAQHRPSGQSRACGVGTSSRSGPGFRSWGYLLLLVTPDVRKPGWTQQAPGGWGSGGATRRARTPWRGSDWGRGPGKRPEVLLYCGQAQGMRGSCTGSRGDARGHSKGLRVAQQGCPQRSSRHRAERPRVGSGPSPAGDRRWQRGAPQSPSVRGPCRDVRT